MKIIFDTDNAYWRDMDGESLDFYTVAMTLRNIAIEVEEGEVEGIIRDRNGNSCGEWSLADK